MEQLVVVPDAVIESAQKRESNILFLAIIDPKSGASRQCWGSIAPIESSYVCDVIGDSPGLELDLNFVFEVYPVSFCAEETEFGEDYSG